jgi:DNA mismatch endonuclease (patch repair protein)
LTFPGVRKVVFVHGCFWHQHLGCRYAYMPKSNLEFWKRKLAANTRRDACVLQKLREQGWSPLVIWECEISDMQNLANRLKSHLGDRSC